jgi:hypothetical protein
VGGNGEKSTLVEGGAVDIRITSTHLLTADSIRVAMWQMGLMS